MYQRDYRRRRMPVSGRTPWLFVVLGCPIGDRPLQLDDPAGFAAAARGSRRPPRPRRLRSSRRLSEDGAGAKRASSHECGCDSWRVSRGLASRQARRPRWGRRGSGTGRARGVAWNGRSPCPASRCVARRAVGAVADRVAGMRGRMPQLEQPVGSDAPECRNLHLSVERWHRRQAGPGERNASTSVVHNDSLESISIPKPDRPT